MIESVAEIHSIDELAAFVHTTLCEKENLLSDQFATRRFELHRDGQPCGLQFHLQGPRSVRLGAVWAAAQNCLYFYDTTGTRYLKVQLARRLMLDSHAA